MDIAGLALNPLLLAVAHHEIRDKEEQETGNGGDDGNADHECEQVTRSVLPQVRKNIQAVADRHALELAQEVELDRGGVHNLAADVVARRVENPELRHRVRDKVGDDTRNLGQAEKGADGDSQNDGETDGRPHANKYTDKHRPCDLQRILATREHAVVVYAAKALVLGLLSSAWRFFFNLHKRAQR